MSARWFRFLLLLPMLAVAPVGPAQSSKALPVPPDQSPLPLLVNTRVVLTDITVTGMLSVHIAVNKPKTR